MSALPQRTIAFDASLWDEPTTGIGLYTHRLATALQAQGLSLQRVGARVSGEAPRGRLPKSFFTLGRLPALLSSSGADLFHGVCNFNLPLTRSERCRYVLTVHDLIPEILPDTVSRLFRLQFRAWLGRSLQLADRVICVSDTTRSALIDRYPVAAGKAVTVPLGIDHVDEVPRPDAAGLAYLAALGLPSQFVLYAGAFDARKNIDLVLEACERLRAAGRPLTLVLAGQRWFGAGSVEKRIAAMRADGFDIRPLGYQSAPVFYELMRRASVFVFPSRYEGFGLPPLEAMRLSTPVIVSTAGSLPEVCGEAALAVRPDDADAVAAHLRRLLDSPAERRTLGERGLVRSQAFTWEKTAARTLAVYQATLEG